jgi:hypothetical protein
MSHTYEFRSCRSVGDSVEECRPDQAEFWGVYARANEPNENGHHLADWVADFETMEQAVKFIKDQGPQPNPDQLARLLQFRDEFGPDWKLDLAAAWYSGADAEMLNGHLLRQIRNQFGPKWLVKFKGLV